MIEAIAGLLRCQLAGEALARGFGLPVPGPVIGLVMLFVALLLRERWRPQARPIRETPIGQLAGFLLAHLSLLFVPAGVGIVGQWDLLARHGVGLIAALIVSTAAALAVTAVVFAAASRRFAGENDDTDSGA